MLLICGKEPSLKALGFLTKSILKCRVEKKVNFRKETKYCTSNTLFTRKCRTKQSHLPNTENLNSKDVLEPYISCWKAFLLYSAKEILVIVSKCANGLNELGDPP